MPPSCPCRSRQSLAQGGGGLHPLGRVRDVLDLAPGDLQRRSHSGQGQRVCPAHIRVSVCACVCAYVCVCVRLDGDSGCGQSPAPAGDQPNGPEVTTQGQGVCGRTAVASACRHEDTGWCQTAGQCVNRLALDRFALGSLPLAPPLALSRVPREILGHTLQ